MAASKTELPVIDDQGIYLFIGTRAGMRVDRHPPRDLLAQPPTPQ
jgi:hypothetical protein